MTPLDWGQKGRVTLITGATGFLGRAVSQAFVEVGATVVLNARHPESLDAVARGLSAEQGKVYTVAEDLTQVDAGERVVQAALRQAGRVDNLILNAGVLDDGLVAGLSENRLAKVFELNVLGSFRVLHATLRRMLLQRSGSIVIVSSTAAQRPGVGQVAYASSKAPLETLVRTTAKETASRGIRVNAVAPGLLSGGMANRVLEEAGEHARRAIPMGRPGGAEEVVPVILFLTSPMSSYVTGQIWTVDGGFTA